MGLSFISVRWSRATLLAASTFLAVAGWTPLGPALLGALEGRFPIPEISGPVSGIILLGGAVDTHLTGERGQVALNEGGERLTSVADLSRRFPQARVFLSGGASHILPTGTVSESAAGRNLLIDLGVAENRIEMEERSRNTCENAAETKAAMAPKADEQWILVTSANHMPRAVACFRAQRFAVVPYPVDFRTLGGSGNLGFSAAVSEGLALLDLAAHEWVGLLTYRLFGLTEEFFPKS
ncbi:MAG: YdcF family protein [Rhizobiales bacterium]|nr:YdcF family protein [Hyphomicrobiales bacterium]